MRRSWQRWPGRVGTATRHAPSRFCNRCATFGYVLLNVGQQGAAMPDPRDTSPPPGAEGADAPRATTFLLARPERRLLRAIATRLPGVRPAGPPHGARAGGGRRVRRGRGDRALLDRGGAARRALVRRLAGRDAGARAPRRAAAVRLLRRPPRGRVRDGGGRPGARAVGVDAPRVGARARRRVPGAVDQLLPGDAGLRALLARVRAARADRGADRADRAARGGGVGRRGVVARADAARRRRAGWRGA